MQQTNSHFYLSGLSGTVAEIIGSWKAVVRFTRNAKEEKAVLLGGSLVFSLMVLMINNVLVSKLRPQKTPVNEDLNIRNQRNIQSLSFKLTLMWIAMRIMMMQGVCCFSKGPK